MTKPFSTLGRAVLVVALAVLLRAGIVGLNQLEQLDYMRFGNLNFFTLPVLELLVLLFIIVPSFWLLKRETQIRNIGIVMLMAVMITALLQIMDMIRSDEICQGPDFYKHEGFCEMIAMQSFCNIPFVVIGLVVLLVWWPRHGPEIVSRRIFMEWRILCAVVAGIAGSFVGFEVSDSIYRFVGPHIARIAVFPLFPLLALGLAIVSWKYRRKPFSYVTIFSATLFVASLPWMMLMVFVLD